MQEVTTDGLIYRLLRYSDRSAVALAFSPDYGKLKLFVPKAFSSKGGFMTFVPGSISFHKKASSDLHKFVAFSHSADYYFYTQTPEIMMRMHLIYDLYEQLFHVEERCKVLWQLSLKFTEDNYRELGLYTIYRLLREAGVMFEPQCNCNITTGDYKLIDGQLFCASCLPELSMRPAFGAKAIPTTAETVTLLQNFGDNSRFRGMSFTDEQEKTLLTIFSSHLDHVLGKQGALKSLKVFMTM
ncbi:MAG: recombination protein O N-terminal domain-containing protein [Deferribacteraceae bacterium]|jgi:DNA repair protein RecO (recombination protein O)|nr:recombination protein O N-terminal domain-containing protein [Deferribacteraceae bacterium]